MKKRFTLLSALLLFSLSIHAQLGFYGSFGLGKYKYYIKDVRQDRSTELNYDFGIEYRITGKGSHIAVAPALEYTPIITKSDVAGQGNGILYYRNRLNYLQFDLPLIYKFLIFADGEKITNTYFDIGAGPFFSKLLKATATAHDLYDKETKQDFKIGDGAANDFKGSNAGLVLQIGVHAKRLSGYIVDNLGYKNITPHPNEKVLTRSLMVRLCLNF